MKDFLRGSEWNMWDLHVHTPASIVNNYSYTDSDKWDGYINDLEHLNSNIKVIGVNDYIFIDGYKRLLEEKSTNNRLQNIDLLLPVIEFRLDKFAGDSHTKRINLHIIFSNEISSDEIETRFLSRIQIKDTLNIGDALPFPLILNNQNLERIGSTIRSKNANEVDYGSKTNIQIAHEQISFNYEDIISILNADSVLKDNYITVIGYSEWSALRNDSSAQIKKQYIKDTDLIFSACENIENFNNAKNKIQNFYGTDDFILLDCSDAHSPITSNNKDRLGNCQTWIKADTTFLGLKQMLIQPKERLFVGDMPPRLAQIENRPNYFISSVEINKIAKPKNKTEKWFDSVSTIPINSGMVAIIGGKGSGKSALADIIGQFCYCKTMDQASFLNEKRFRKSPKKLAEDYEGHIVWCSKQVDKNINLMEEKYPSSIEKAQYLPQKYIEEVCNNLDNEFQEEIDKVIFSYIDENKKMGQNSLQNLINAKISEITINKERLRKSIVQYLQKLIIVQDKSTKNYKIQVNDHIKALKEELINHLKLKPAYVKKPSEVIDKDTAQKLDFLNKQILKREKYLKILNQKYSDINIQIENLKKYKQEYSDTEIRLKNLESDLNRYLTENMLISKTKISLSIKSNIDIVDKLIESLSQKLSKLEILCGQTGKLSYENKLNILKAKLDKLIQNTDQEQRLYQSYLSKRKEWKERILSIIGKDDIVDTLRYYKAEKLFIEKNLSDAKNLLKQQRRELVKEAYSLLEEKAKIYIEIYKPVKEKLGNILGKIDNEVQFTVDKVYKNTNIETYILERINQKMSSVFKGKNDGAVYISNLKKDIDLTKSLTIYKFINRIIEDIENSENPNKLCDNRMQLFEYLIALDFLDISFALKMSGRNISELSAGEKGLLLLIFYLALNKESKPLIIDQPEDNLDNESVYSKLVPCIQEAKINRQLIIVTHNPNIAVACDAEQIIYCSIDKKNHNEIKYISGSIENPKIKKHIVDVLEGTEPAFNLRKQKYNI